MLVFFTVSLPPARHFAYHTPILIYYTRPQCRFVSFTARTRTMRSNRGKTIIREHLSSSIPTHKTSVGNHTCPSGRVGELASSRTTLVVDPYHPYTTLLGSRHLRARYTYEFSYTNIYTVKFAHNDLQGTYRYTRITKQT